MRKKWIFLAGLLLCLLAGGWALYQYQKPRSSVARQVAVEKFYAEQLYAHFKKNEKEATQKYAGKVLEVRGIVKEVEHIDNGMLVLLKASATPGGISCNMAYNSKAKRLAAGDRVTVKGRCTGFLMDVNLVDVVLID